MMKVYALVRTDSSGDVQVELDLDKRNIVDRYSDLVRNYVAEHLVNESLEYEDMVYMPLTEIEELMEEIVEGRGTDLTSYGWETIELNTRPLFYGDSDMSQRVRDYVEYTLVERAKIKSLISEADFLAGAMAAMAAVATPDGEKVENMWPGNPPYWVFFTMSGRSVAAQVLKNKGEEGTAKRVEFDSDQFSRRYSVMDDMVNLARLVMKLSNDETLRAHADNILDSIMDGLDED